MTQFTLPIAVHACAALFVLLVGPVNIFRPRRDLGHRVLGYSWLIAMYATCVSSFFFGLEDGFTWLHGLSVFTFCSVSAGVVFIRLGNVRAHQANMVGSYAGTLVAFVFAALVPDRLIATTLTGDNPWPLIAAVTTVAAIAAVWVVVVVRRWSPAHIPRPAPVPVVGR